MTRRRRRYRGGKAFTELFDRLRESYGCPTEVLFAIACDDLEETKHRVTAARTLLRHRYPAQLVLADAETHDQLDEFTRLLQGLGDERLAHQEQLRLEDQGEVLDAEYTTVEEDPLLR